MASTISDTWCNNNYVSAIQLVECKIVCFHSIARLAICRYCGHMTPV